MKTLVRSNRRDEEQIATCLRSWLRNVGLFLHGFILFRLCRAIEEKHAEKAIGKLEDEIWMTSFRCLAVVKTTKFEEETKTKVGEAPQPSGQGDA